MSPADVLTSLGLIVAGIVALGLGAVGVMVCVYWCTCLWNFIRGEMR